MDDEIKLADLGSCRGIYSRQPFTEYISTRWYRAPECLLTDGYYNFKMDLFAAGCVCFEIVALFPLFPGQNEMDQIQKIHNVLGTPSPELLTRKFKRNASHMDFNFPEKKGTGIERLIPHADADLVELLKKLTRYDPDERILARQALKDPFFRELRDAEKDLTSSAPMSGGQASSGGVGGGNARSRDPSGGAKAAMSSSSSAVSDHLGDLGGAAGAPELPAAAPQEEERSPGLPTIGGKEKQRHKGAGGGVPGASNTGGAASNAGGAGGDQSEDDGREEGMLLPPIGGLRGKRGDSKVVDKSKTQTFKAAANATLQQKPVGVGAGSSTNHSLGVLGAGTSTSMSSTDAMSSTNPHNWGGTKEADTMRGVSSGSGRPSVDKMSSTWAPNQNSQSRRYVSPSGAKLALGGGKKR